MLLADKISENHSKTDRNGERAFERVSLTGCARQWRWRPYKAAGTCSARWPGSSQQLPMSVPWSGKNSCAERWRWPKAECHHWSLGQHLQMDRGRGQRSGISSGVRCVQVLGGDLLCSPLGRSMDRRTSSAMSNDRSPFNRLSQNSCRKSWQTIERQMEHSSCQPRPVFCSDSCLRQSLNANQTLLVTKLNLTKKKKQMQNTCLWILLKKKE